MKLSQLHALLYGVTSQFQADQALPSQEVVKRDRELGLQCQQKKTTEKILFWLCHVESSSSRASRFSIQSSLQAFVLGCSFFGFIAGYIAGSAVLFYDGSRPVNVFAILTIFVFLPNLLLTLLIVRLTMTKIIDIVYKKHASPINHDSSHFTWLTTFLLPKTVHTWLTSVRESTQLHRILFAKAEKTTFFLALQHWTFWYILGGAGCLAFFTATSDLAFSWNVTPSFVTPSVIHSITNVLSLPWSTLAPDSTPSLDLIEKSRYYRFQPLLQSNRQIFEPHLLAGWWSFLLLSIVCWGAFPRLILLFLTRVKLRHMLSSTLQHLPNVPELLWRLESNLVTTSTTRSHSEKDDTQNLEKEVASYPIYAKNSYLDLPLSTHDFIILYSLDKNSYDYVEHIVLLKNESPFTVYKVGGASTTFEEQNIIQSLRSVTSTERIVLYIKSWEPPLGEFLDFLIDVRNATNNTMPLYIVPLVYKHPNNTSLETSGPMIWAAKLKALQDPWIHLLQPLKVEIKAKSI
jgi:hypothetical protein